MDTNKIEVAIRALASKVKASTHTDDALVLSQAILNLANARTVIVNKKPS
jgi:hypothetical protein